MTTMRSVPGQRGSLQGRAEAGHTFKVLLLEADYTPADEHTDVADVTSWEASGGGYTRATLTGVAWNTAGALPALVADDATVAGTGPEILYAYVYDDSDDELLLLVTFDAPITLSGELPIEWNDGQLAVYDDDTDDIEALDLRVAVLEAAPPGGGAVATVAEVEPVEGDVPAVDLAAALAGFFPSALPTLESVGLFASQDWRAAADGDVAYLSTPVDTPPLHPVTNGPGLLGSIGIVDPTGYAPSAPLSVVSGAMRAPEAPVAENAVIPTYVIGTPTSDTYRSTVGFADVTDLTGSPDEAGINLTITSPQGSGPVCHFAAYDPGSGAVTRVKVGVDYFDGVDLNVIMADGYEVDLPTLLGSGDRGCLSVDTVARTWDVEVNGEVVLSAALVDDGAGGENLVVDGDVVGNIDAPLDFDDIYVNSTPTSRAADDGYVCGVEWWAFSVDDVDLDVLAIDGRDWARLVEQGRAIYGNEVGGGGTPTSRTITAGTGLTGGGDLTANRTLTADFGTGAGKVTEGNDARLSDARTPTAHSATLITSDTIDPARLPFVFVAKASNESVSSSTTVQNDDALVVAQPASERWIYEVKIAHQGDSSADIKFAVSVPSGATIHHFLHGPRVNDALLQSSAYSSTAGAEFPACCLGTSSPLASILHLDVTTSTTPGNVQVKWAQNATSATASTVLAGSTITGRRVA